MPNNQIANKSDDKFFAMFRNLVEFPIDRNENIHLRHIKLKKEMSKIIEDTNQAQKFLNFVNRFHKKLKLEKHGSL